MKSSILILLFTSVFLSLFIFAIPIAVSEEYDEHYLVQAGDYVRKSYNLDTGDSISWYLAIEVYSVGTGSANIRVYVFNHSVYQAGGSIHHYHHNMEYHYRSYQYSTGLSTTLNGRFTAPYEDRWHIIFLNEGDSLEHLYLTVGVERFYFDPVIVVVVASILFGVLTIILSWDKIRQFITPT